MSADTPPTRSPHAPTTTSIGAADRDPTRALAPYVEEGALAGAVTLVASREGVLSHGAVGWSNIERRIAMRPDSFFWIASMTKPMTAVAVMMLVDEGKLNLDDPVEKHLGDFTGMRVVAESSEERTVLVPAARPITLRDCLCHVSGLPFLARPERGKIDVLWPREAAIAYAMSPLLFQPGTKYEYSNVGINTAARILEVVSGAQYHEFMQGRLLDPLGMTDTTFWPTSEQLGRLATAYQPAEDGSGLVERTGEFFTYPLGDHSRAPCPAGGYFSSAADVGRFCRMVLRGGELDGVRYLSEAAVGEMTRKQTGDLETSYGLGWAVDPAGRGFGHGGAAATDMWVHTRTGLAMVYLVQHAGYACEDGEKILPTFRAAAAAFGEQT